MTTESREQDPGSARASRKSRGSPAIIEAGGSGALTDAQIKHMVSRFLGWRLPDPFRPDNGITFTPTAHQRGEYGPAHWPVGTNLLDATQAESMVRHMIEGLPETVELDAVGAAERDVGRWAYRRIEALMDAKPDTPEAAELAWLAEVVESIEEYGSEACADTALAAFLALSAAPERVEGGGWEPIESAPRQPGASVLLWFPAFVGCEPQIGTWRQWSEPFYGLDGEWISPDTGDGFETVGDGQVWPTHWQPLPSPPIGAEGGRPSSAGDSGCGEGTQEPSPSGAQSDDGRGG